MKPIHTTFNIQHLQAGKGWGVGRGGGGGVGGGGGGEGGGECEGTKNYFWFQSAKATYSCHRLNMAQAESVIYCCLTADILTKFYRTVS